MTLSKVPHTSGLAKGSRERHSSVIMSQCVWGFLLVGRFERLGARQSRIHCIHMPTKPIAVDEVMKLVKIALLFVSVFRVVYGCTWAPETTVPNHKLLVSLKLMHRIQLSGTFAPQLP